MEWPNISFVSCWVVLFHCTVSTRRQIMSIINVGFRVENIVNCILEIIKKKLGLQILFQLEMTTFSTSDVFSRQISKWDRVQFKSKSLCCCWYFWCILDRKTAIWFFSPSFAAAITSGQCVFFLFPHCSTLCQCHWKCESFECWQNVSLIRCHSTDKKTVARVWARPLQLLEVYIHGPESGFEAGRAGQSSQYLVWCDLWAVRNQQHINRWKSAASMNYDPPTTFFTATHHPVLVALTPSDSAQFRSEASW